jgi:hypothetical protein
MKNMNDVASVMSEYFDGVVSMSGSYVCSDEKTMVIRLKTKYQMSYPFDDMAIAIVERTISDSNG